MVDPNRKINRLPDKDVNFLEECESEFALRYTKDDDEFMAHCAKPAPEPPLVDNWTSGGGGGPPGGNSGGGGYSGSYNNRYNGGHRRGGGDRGWHRRGGGGGYNNDRGRGNCHKETNATHLYIMVFFQIIAVIVMSPIIVGIVEAVTPVEQVHQTVPTSTEIEMSTKQAVVGRP